MGNGVEDPKGEEATRGSWNSECIPKGGIVPNSVAPRPYDQHIKICTN